MDSRKHQTGFTLIELMIVVAILAILATIAFQLYRNYVVRSQVNRVMSEIAQLRTGIETCLNEGRTAIGTGPNECDPSGTGSNLITGTGNSAPGVTLPDGTGSATIDDPLTPTASITATFGGTAHLEIHGATLSWSRDAESSWTCSTTVDEIWRPAGCQQ